MRQLVNASFEAAKGRRFDRHSVSVEDSHNNSFRFALRIATVWGNRPFVNLPETTSGQCQGLMAEKMLGCHCFDRPLALPIRFVAAARG